MREYNDYVQTTKEYLRRYKEFHATVENLHDEIEAQEKLLALDAAAPVVKYGDDTSGGSGELTSTEAAAARRMEIESSVMAKKLEAENIELTIRKVDRALSAISPQEKKLVEGYYINRESWRDLSVALFMTEKWASHLGNKAIKNMASIIFGLKDVQNNLFVFYA